MPKPSTPNWDEAANDYATNASAKSSKWRDNIQKVDVAGALKTKGPKSFKARLNDMATAYEKRVQAVTNEDIFKGVREYGETNYRSGVTNSKDKWKKGMAETVGAALAETELPEKSPIPMDANNVQRWQKIVEATHKKAQVRRGLK
jgi:hypothetical protein